MKYFALAFFTLLILFNFSPDISALSDRISAEDIKKIGGWIFENECSSKEELLLQWNEGEEFLSLGIGHFIWYPSGVKKIFTESFPVFIKYAEKSGQRIPAWLAANLDQPCPWSSRSEFAGSQEDTRMKELRKFLSATKDLQSYFMVAKLDDALSQMLKNSPEKDRRNIEAQFNRMASSGAGIFAMIDYINFKGLGISPSERYRGKGWGLIQVLSGMKGEGDYPDPLEEFVYSAKKVLEERVYNSPPERNEKRWLAGWSNRVKSYLNKNSISIKREPLK